jgi:hypothetical protein
MLKSSKGDVDARIMLQCFKISVLPFLFVRSISYSCCKIVNIYYGLTLIGIIIAFTFVSL